MARYFTLSRVKDLLGIEGTEDDQLLVELGEDAEDQIDERLRPYTQVPLTEPPEELKHIADWWVAGLYRLRVSGERSFLEEAELRLRWFIQSRYGASLLARG
jgi:hypothetical protein